MQVNSLSILSVISGIVKTDANGLTSTATAGTDYQAPLNYVKGSQSISYSSSSNTPYTISYGITFASTPQVIPSLVTGSTAGNSLFWAGYYYSYMWAWNVISRGLSSFVFQIIGKQQVGVSAWIMGFGFSGYVDWIAWL
jgi:hypothetical protein